MDVDNLIYELLVALHVSGEIKFEGVDVIYSLCTDEARTVPTSAANEQLDEPVCHWFTPSVRHRAS